MQDLGTIHESAAKAAAFFQTAERANGDKYDRLRDDAPEWLRDAVRTAHAEGEILPDDYVFGYAREAVDLIAEEGEHLTDEGLDDLRQEFADGVDTYNSELLAWLGSHLLRAGYCDEATAEYGADDTGDIMRTIARGQYREREFVFGVMLDALRRQS